MTKIRLVCIAVVSAAALAGCGVPGNSAPELLVPTVIAQAIDSKRLEDAASAECLADYPSSQFVAAFESTPTEVREIAVVPRGREVADIEGLPADASARVLICIAFGSNKETATYMAMWKSEGEGGVITIFDADDLARTTG